MGVTAVAPPALAVGPGSHQPSSIIAAMVEIAFPSSRLFTKTNVRRSGPAALASAISARPAARASGFSSLMLSQGSNAFTACSYFRPGLSRKRAATRSGLVRLPGNHRQIARCGAALSTAQHPAAVQLHQGDAGRGNRAWPRVSNRPRAVNKTLMFQASRSRATAEKAGSENAFPARHPARGGGNAAQQQQGLATAVPRRGERTLLRRLGAGSHHASTTNGFFWMAL